MTYKKEFDIASKSFDFAKDLKYGQAGEGSIVSFYESVIQGSAEIKTDRYRNGRMDVETNQNPKNKVNELGQKIWDLSGINVTTAQWWIYIYCLNQSIVVVSVERLKKYLHKNPKEFVEVVTQIKGESKAHLESFLKKVETGGGEGVMLVKPNTKYIGKRSRRPVIFM